MASQLKPWPVQYQGSGWATWLSLCGKRDQRNWDAQLNIHRLDTDGTDASPLGGELDGFRNTHINAKARLELSATASLRVNLRQVNTEREGRQAGFRFSNPDPGPNC